MTDKRVFKCCSVEGCLGKGKKKGNRFSFQNGLCERHRRIWKTHGDPEYVTKHLGYQP